jgi:hypothetical protein
MADRRMFAKTIIDSDAFLDMPITTQVLYFHLCMRADDEGFINNPKKIQRMVGCNDDDLKLLIVKSFVIPFETGIIVIKHWKLHNYIRKDRFKATVYKEERSVLFEKENGVYAFESPEDKNQINETENFNNCNEDAPCGYEEISSGNQPTTKCQPSDDQSATNCQPNGDKCVTQVRLGKVRLGKDSIGKEDILHGADDSASMQEEDSPIIISLMLNDKTHYHVNKLQVDEWKELYPAVDVEQQLRNMKGWLDSNPKRRKTKSGILKFITSWLAREQDRGGTYRGQGKSKSNMPEMSPERQKAYEEMEVTAAVDLWPELEAEHD